MRKVESEAVNQSPVHEGQSDKCDRNETSKNWTAVWRQAWATPGMGPPKQRAMRGLSPAEGCYEVQGEGKCGNAKGKEPQLLPTWPKGSTSILNHDAFALESLLYYLVYIVQYWQLCQKYWQYLQGFFPESLSTIKYNFTQWFIPSAFIECLGDSKSA